MSAGLYVHGLRGKLTAREPDAERKGPEIGFCSALAEKCKMRYDKDGKLCADMRTNIKPGRF